jgi:hypothetical protein
VVGLAPAAALGDEPAVIVHGASGDLRVRLDDTMARFEAAGLRLPGFEIAFNDESGCAGRLGGPTGRPTTEISA